MTAPRYDAIVVGSGATGGWAAMELTRAGLSVIVVDAGTLLSRPPKLGDPARWSDADRELAARQPIQHDYSRAFHPSLFVDDHANPYETPARRPFRWIRSRVVGGRTNTWNAITPRLSDLDFAASELDGCEGAWPLRYAELAPYYERAEAWLGVSGARDGIAHHPHGDYLAPRRLTYAEQLFKHRVEAKWLERRVVHQRGILSARRMRSTSSTLADARRTGRLTLQPNTIVSHVVVDNRRGVARGVACIDRVTHRTFELSARAVVLCASAIESVRILLGTERVASANDVVGRYVIDHTMVSASGAMRSVRRRRCSPQAHGPYGIYVPRFRNVGRSRARFKRGYGIQGLIQRGPRDTPTAAGVPFQLVAFGEVIPQRDNRVTLDPSVRDAWQVPVARIDYRYGANERAMVNDIVAVFAEMFELCEMEPSSEAITWPIPGTSIHECGGARMGADPSSSVVDRFNRVWSVPNLVVTDGSCFPSSGCQNPTLTMIALTIRACEQLARELARGGH